MQDLVTDLMEDPEEFKFRAKAEGLDLNARDENGKTILHHLTASLANAPMEMREDIFAAMKAVLDLGAAPHVMDNSGKAAGAYIDQTEENNPALEMIFEAQQKFNPGKTQEQYSPIGAEVRNQAQAAAAPLQNLGRNNNPQGSWQSPKHTGRGGR